MTDNKKTGLDLLIEEVAKPTPLSINKLKSVWPSLPLEYQLEILNGYKSTGKNLPSSVLPIVLDSSIPLIKNLAIRLTYLDSDKPEDTALLDQIKNDPDDLIRYASSEAIGISFSRTFIKPEGFLKMPQAERLSMLSGNGAPSGRRFSSIVRHLVDQNIDEVELKEIIEEYSQNNKVNRGWEINPYEGDSWHAQLQDFESLWELVVDLPKSVVWPLIEDLPTKTPNGDRIPDEVLDALDPALVYSLLYRENAERLGEFRRKVFFDKTGKYKDHCRSAACCFNFRIKDEELGELFESGSESLSDLSMSNSILPVQLKAIETYFYELPDTKGYTYASSARSTLDNRLEKIDSNSDLEEDEIVESYRQLRLFKMANTILPWGKTEYEFEELYGDDITYIKEKITAKTTWDVYCQLKQQHQRDHREYGKEALEQYLISYYGPYVDDMEQSSDLDSKLSETKADLIEKLDQFDVGLANWFNTLNKNIDATKILNWVALIGLGFVVYRLL